MPWTEKDAQRFTKKANSAPKREAWAATANAVLNAGQPEGVAVRAANAHVRQLSTRKK
jgi:uncharacterized protein YdaT